MGKSVLSRIVVVSNRVAEPKAGKSAGGLTVGVMGALKQQGGIWFGWGGTTCTGEAKDAELKRRGKITFATIELNETDFDAYYNGFSNGSLWPLAHYLLGFFSYDRSQYEAWRRVNTTFARKLLPLLEPDDLIWVHDYHLFPLAEELRRAGVTNPIGFFLHVPFPGIAVLQALPPWRQILQSLCMYDVIGFQTEQDREDFLECLRFAGLGGDRRGNDSGRIEAIQRRLTVDVFPIGIDVDECAQQAQESARLASVQRLERALMGRPLIMGVDRLDYSKGLPDRFRAFDQLLSDYPSSRGQLVYMQIAPPTRAGVRAYQDIREELEQLTGNINGRFAEPEWVPIRYLNRGFARPTLMGFLRLARIGFVTPLRDGMNLVAKEYVAAQDPADPGVLVLSQLAGAARELTSAVMVNPYDGRGVAEGLQTAASMAREERVERHTDMLAVLRKNDINVWRQRFVEALENSRQATGAGARESAYGDR
jgi:trehalose 6-phosphate synthase